MTDGTESRLKKTAMSVGGGAIMLVVFAVVLLLIAIVLRGMVWVSDKAMPWLVWASVITLLICIFILAPMCIFRKARPVAGVAYYYASWVFGLMLWAYSCLFTVSTWGYGALAIGLIFLGVGVVPIAFLSSIFHAEWVVLAEIVVSLILTFGVRFLGIWLTTPPKQERTEEEILMEYLTKGE